LFAQYLRPWIDTCRHHTTDKQTHVEVYLLTFFVLLAIFHIDLTVPYIGETS